MSLNQNPVVDVLMVTYNQENFINEAIESVLMQKTNFEYRLIIGEDCSTDNTPNICLEFSKKYSDRIKVIFHSVNQGLMKNYKSVFNEVTAKYITILEGDDYWIDEYKLQKQVDFLEQNREIGLIHTGCQEIYYCDNEAKCLKVLQKKKYIKDGYAFEDLLKNNFIHPLTVMFRKELFDKYVSVDNYIGNGFRTIDYPMWLDISRHCSICYLDYNTAAYRIHIQSITHSNNHKQRTEFCFSNYLIKKNAIEKYIYNEDLLIQLENNYKEEQLIFEISCRHYENVYKLGRNFKVFNFKSFLLKVVSTTNVFIYLYSKYIEFKKNDSYSLAT